MARPMPWSSGHWAQIPVTSVWSKRRRASKTLLACSALSATGPSRSTGSPSNRGAYSSKQIIPSPSRTCLAMKIAPAEGSPFTTVTGALGA